MQKEFKLECDTNNYTLLISADYKEFMRLLKVAEDIAYRNAHGGKSENELLDARAKHLEKAHEECWAVISNPDEELRLRLRSMEIAAEQVELDRIASCYQTLG